MRNFKLCHFRLWHRRFLSSWWGFDDNWKDEKAASRHELVDAIRALLQGKKVAVHVTLAMGCSIKWKGSPES